MTKRARLRYFDSNNNGVVIGSINESGTSGIDQLTLRNSGRQFTKATVVGGQELFGKFPTKSSEVTPQNNASGPEIFLEVFNQSTGQFEVRDRLYAESQGVVTDGGRFKHKRLYGFEKFVGRQKVQITEANAVTSDIEQVLKDVLPTGYTVQAEAPSGGSIPSVNSYTVNGSLNSVFQDLQENYNYFVFFTGQTDGSGNYIVRLEPRGFGGQVDTFEKGVDPVFFDKWTKGDELRRVTEAQVIGTDGSGNTIKETASTNPNNGRFTRKNIGYITDSAEAKNIAVNLIAADSDGGTPESTEHGKITAPLDEPATSNLNKSIQVINDEINVDDLFTVVEQRDFFHQSQTQYSFEFEKELTTQEQQDKKDLGNRNAELITEQQAQVGEQGLTDVSTGEALSDTKRDPDTGLDTDKQAESFRKATFVPTRKVETGTVGTLVNSNGNAVINVSFSTDFRETPNIQVTPKEQYVENFRARNADKDGFDLGVLTNFSDGSPVSFFYRAVSNEDIEQINITTDVPQSPAASEQNSSVDEDTSAFFDGVEAVVTVNNYSGDLADVDIDIINETTNDVLNSTSIFVDNGTSQNFSQTFSSSEVSVGDEIKAELTENDFQNSIGFLSGDNEKSKSSVVFTLQSKSEHDLGDDIDTVDNLHGGPNQTSTHDVVDANDPVNNDPKTDSKNVQTGTEEKVNR